MVPTDWSNRDLERMAGDVQRLQAAVDGLPIKYALLQQEVSGLRDDLHGFRTVAESQRTEARDDVKALRSAIITFALTIAGTGVTVAISVLTGLFG